ncbi:putative transposase for insertion sequence NGRIS-9 (plasmid) [Ensifer adhaerens OV14]|nr:putative transposase for insertion sequence NGRIS-9 [Ensifer adhaerens OV14]
MVRIGVFSSLASGFIANLIEAYGASHADVRLDFFEGGATGIRSSSASSTPSRVSSPSSPGVVSSGVFKGVVDLQAATNRFVVDHNQQSKPFVWSADPDKIIAAAARGHLVLESNR